MNVLPREKQIEVIAALCEGVGIRAASRLTVAASKPRLTLRRIELLDVALGALPIPRESASQSSG
ncbi:hypothetical protein AB8B21_18280 [Tardiphaga sp. 866_E4_N2_1]|uniref:hypothetical protein n=1 Tax=unclassified Tardiphaga TaxID=2631404 RepID=UPI003F271059